MHRRMLATTALTLLLTGCSGGEPAAAPTPSPTTSTPAHLLEPATLDNPLGMGDLDLGSPSFGGVDTSALALRDELFTRFREAGGVRLDVTGLPQDTTVELAPPADTWGTGQRRFTWTERGAERETVQLTGGRVCVNRVTGRALHALGAGSPMGWITASDQPFSCTEPGSSVGGFVVSGLTGYDVMTRLGHLQGETTLTDLGVETDGEGAPTRHVRIEATETQVLEAVPTTYDLWLDGDLRIVRADYTRLTGRGSYTATLTYGDVGPISLPPAGERGVLGFQPGSGHVGSFLGPRGTAPGSAPR